MDDQDILVADPAIGRYADRLGALITAAEATDGEGRPLLGGRAFTQVIAAIRRARDTDAKVMFIGNGGSAGIASHMAIDYTKNGGIPSLAFNDGAALTCLGNDLGYENVFARQVTAHGRRGDVLIAISSSGRSPNILRAVEAGRAREVAMVLSLSGFDADNPLRGLGDVNFHVASHQYGFVEIAHLALLHAILDFHCGCVDAASGIAVGKP